MTNPPETLDWPGIGTATRLEPRGMSDYERGCDGRFAIYETEDGHAITRGAGGSWWSARYRGATTKRRGTMAEAIAELEGRIG